MAARAGRAKKRMKAKREHRDVTILLLPGIGPDDDRPTLHKNADTHRPDRIRWWNKDTRGHTITFTGWPFAEPPQSIAIEAGNKSGWFTVYEDPSNIDGRYGYSIDPIMDPFGPPDGPGVIVDD